MGHKAGPTARVAEFVTETSLHDVPADAVRGAKNLILDTLGVGLAAVDQPVAATIRDHVATLGGPPAATIIGAGGRKAAAPTAALANGALVNILDYDGFWHVATHVLPAVLAVGEATGASGAAALEAFILAAEVADRLREAIEARRDEQAGPTYRGWYHVSLYGPMTAALAAGKLLGLSTGQARAAVGIAANSSGGFRQNLGTSAKSLLSGNSASSGVTAALLAARGMAGDPDILEARVGFANALCLPGECDWKPVTDSLGRPYKLAGPLGLKAYPAVGPTQCVIASLRELRARRPFGPADVTSVEARLSSFSAGLEYPSDVLGANFSWPYILAATVVDGTFGVPHLRQSSIDKPAIRAFADKITFAEAGPDDGAGRLTVRLANGEALTTKVDRRLGRADTTEALTAKYRDCAAVHLDDDRAGQLHDQIMAIEEAESLAGLTRLLG
jgi:2-methylcitrate dehydratase PrpD